MTEQPEPPLVEWRANRTQSSLRAVGGKLALYPDRLEFTPHKFDRATGGGAWSAGLGQIRSADKQKRGFNPLNGSLRERLRVETTRGVSQLFVVSGLDQVIERIRGALPARPNG